MTTETTTATITTPTATLRAILAALDEYTHPDKTRHVLTLAHLTPVIIEQTANVDAPPTALIWEATNSYALLRITHHTAHTLTAPALIDPAQLLAAMPKKNEARYAGPITLTLTGATWQLTTAATTSTGTTPHADSTWPNTQQLFEKQHPELTPTTYASTMLATLIRAAHHLTSTAGTALTLATMRHNNQTNQPDPNGPSVWHIDAASYDGALSAVALHMPQRRPTK
jgi:hypothetical protein